jgi:hypothetical protein
MRTVLSSLWMRLGKVVGWENYARYATTWSGRVFDLLMRGVLARLPHIFTKRSGDRVSYAFRAVFALVSACVLAAFPLAAAVFGDAIRAHPLWFVIGGLGWLMISEAQEYSLRSSRYGGTPSDQLDPRVFFALFIVEILAFVGVKFGALQYVGGAFKIFLLGIAFGAVADGTNTALTILFARVPLIASMLGLGPDDISEGEPSVSATAASALPASLPKRQSVPR